MSGPAWTWRSGARWLQERVAVSTPASDPYGPFRPVGARLRERAALEVAVAHDSRWCAFVHRAWAGFLGDEPTADAEEVVLAHARACARAGRPVDDADLAAVLPPEAVRAVRAIVADAALASRAGNSVDRLGRRLRGREPLLRASTVTDVVVAAWAVPLGLPWVAAGAALDALGRSAPPIPPVQVVSADPNLLTELLADAVPALLAHAAVRSVVLAAPAGTEIGVRAGRTTSTVRLDRHRIEVSDGLSSDALLVVVGDQERLLRIASGSIARQVSRLRVQPNPRGGHEQ